MASMIAGAGIVVLYSSADINDKGGSVPLFLVGVRLRIFLLVGASLAAAIPIIWRFLRDYQRSRIYTFLNRNSNPLGAGYQIVLSKIVPRLFPKRVPPRYSEPPELPTGGKPTHFIFTTFAERSGLVAGFALLTVYIPVIVYGFANALRSRNYFGRLLGLGIVTNFFHDVFINTAMVTGLIPSPEFRCR
jgi:rod shape determining protein RodA